jgi:hypothetical protein
MALNERADRNTNELEWNTSTLSSDFSYLSSFTGELFTDYEQYIETIFAYQAFFVSRTRLLNLPTIWRTPLNLRIPTRSLHDGGGRAARAYTAPWSGAAVDVRADGQDGPDLRGGPAQRAPRESLAVGFHAQESTSDNPASQRATTQYRTR